MEIGFCGTGMMGAPMAIRLVEAGHEVAVWNRTAAKARPVVERGATLVDTPADAAREAGVVVTMLADEPALHAVVLGDRGVGTGMAPGATLVEMSTVGPEAVGRIRDGLPDTVEMVDAPVLGSVPQATNGELKIFVGGTQEQLAGLRPLLEVLGTPRLMGPLGSGAAMKLVVNATLPALMTTLGESLALADGLRLREADVLDVLAESAIGITVRSKRRNIESGTYPPNFKLGLALKDSGLVNEAAEAVGVAVRLAPAAKQWLTEAAEAGLGDLDYSAVIAVIRGKPAKPAALAED
jgi:3-hydroxyisobutyrate dehydrogenase-like beta-hydroxyacid dehydrogenase